MAFEEVEKGPEQYGRYWNPEEVGDAVEGNIYKFVTDDYGNKRIDLYLGQDEDDEAIFTDEYLGIADYLLYDVGAELENILRFDILKK